MNEILGRMEAKLACGTGTGECGWLGPLQYYAYSAHDTTIMALLGALESGSLMRAGKPNYAGCVLFELWRMPDGSGRVQVPSPSPPPSSSGTLECSVAFETVYKDGFDVDFANFTVPGCPADAHGACSLAQLKVLYHRLSANAYLEVCCLCRLEVSHLFPRTGPKNVGLTGKAAMEVKS